MGNFPLFGNVQKKLKLYQKIDKTSICCSKITKFAANNAYTEYLCVRFLAFDGTDGVGLGCTPHGAYGLGSGHGRCCRGWLSLAAKNLADVGPVRKNNYAVS